jgi:ATP-dependent Clp protease, protease subunit
MALTARMLDEGNDKDKKEEAAPGFQGVAQALYKSRTVLIFGEINDKVAERVCAQLLALATEGEGEIKVVVSSPGGHVESGDAIFDMIRFVKPQVKIIGTGWVGSIAAHIYLAADKANRLCTPNTRFLLHQPFGGVRGQASDIEIEAEEILKMRGRINAIIAQETGQPLDKVNDDTLRNFWMGADEAIAYGLVGRVVPSIADV